MNCFQCKAPLRSHFAITHYSIDHKVKVHATLCSVACVVKWSIGYGVALGKRNLRTLLKALPGK